MNTCRIERTALLGALDRLAPAIPGRATRSIHPVLMGVRLDVDGDTLTLSGTDGDLKITVRLEGAGWGGHQSAVVAYRPFLAAVRSAPKDETLRIVFDFPGKTTRTIMGKIVAEPEVRLEWALVVVRFATYPIEDWPEPKMVEGYGWEMPAAVAAAIRDGARSALGDPTRPILCQVIVDDENVWATDSYRLFVSPHRAAAPGFPTEQGRWFGVPVEAARLMPKAAVAIVLGEEKGEWQDGNTAVAFKRIKGEPPNYRVLIPTSHDWSVTFDRDQLAAALARIRALSSGWGGRGETPLILSLEDGDVFLRLTMQDRGMTEEHLDRAAVTKQPSESPFALGLNYHFMTDALRSIQSPVIHAEGLGRLKPVKFHGGEGTLYLQMPVRMT
jgi:DNA polymerase-3 subunit beta